MTQIGHFVLPSGFPGVSIPSLVVVGPDGNLFSMGVSLRNHSATLEGITNGEALNPKLDSTPGADRNGIGRYVYTR